INAASFGAVMVALLAVRLPDRSPASEEGTLRQRIVTGIQGAAAERGCRTAIITIGVTALLISPFIALIAAVSINLLHKGAGGTSFLVTAQGVGAVAGALALPPLAERFGRRRVLLTDLGLVLPVCILLYAMAPNIVLAILALVAVGAA